MVPFWGRGWQLPGYDGRDLLAMIRKVKPDVLERFVQFRPDALTSVPMGDGAKTRSALEKTPLTRWHGACDSVWRNRHPDSLS